MNRTPIDWVKNPDGAQGYTWNPITGCLNGCDYCYARKLANGRLKQRYLANDNVAITKQTYALDETVKALNDPFYPRFWEDRLEQYLGSRPTGIFVCDMSDLFGVGIPEEWTRRVLNKFQAINYDDHRFYLLTKQPQNLIKFSPFPDNCWVGVTVADDEMIIRALDHLKGIEAKVKYLSIEPFLGQINTFWLDVYLRNSGINQVIIGAQTKPNKQPESAWVREIIEACDKAGIPVFIKQNMNSENLPANAFNKEGLVRREMPV